MKKIVILLIVLIIQSLCAQEATSCCFFIDGQKFTKPIKYVKYDSKIDKKKINDNKIYFYVKGETFVFSKDKSKIDTCNISNLNKIKFEMVEGLSDKEFLFYN